MFKVYLLILLALRSLNAIYNCKFLHGKFHNHEAKNHKKTSCVTSKWVHSKVQAVLANSVANHQPKKKSHATSRCTHPAQRTTKLGVTDCHSKIKIQNSAQLAKVIKTKKGNKTVRLTRALRVSKQIRKQTKQRTEPVPISKTQRMTRSRQSTAQRTWITSMLNDQQREHKGKNNACTLTGLITMHHPPSLLGSEMLSTKRTTKRSVHQHGLNMGQKKKL